MSRWIRDWGPAAFWALAIFLVSGRRTTGVPLEPGWDKVAHLAAYLVLGAALAWAGTRRRLPPGRMVLAGIGYAATDEIHQMFVPGRHADVLDWVADAAGVLLGVALSYPLLEKLTLRAADR